MIKRTSCVEAFGSILVQQICDISHVDKVAHIIVVKNVEDLDLEDFLLRRTIFILAYSAIRFFDREASHRALSLIFFFKPGFTLLVSLDNLEQTLLPARIICKEAIGKTGQHL